MALSPEEQEMIDYRDKVVEFKGNMVAWIDNVAMPALAAKVAIGSNPPTPPPPPPGY